MRRFENGEAEKRCGEYREHLREVRAEQELNGLSDIVIYPAPLLDGVDNGREVVVREHHVCNILCDVRAGYAHAYSDIRALYRRRVVDAVARHGGYLAFCAPGVDYSRLVLGLHACVYIYIFDSVRELFVAHRGELRAGYCL